MRQTQTPGLDDTSETERPWSSTAPDPTDGTPTPADRAETDVPNEGLRVVVEYIVIDGEDAHALAQRQGAALREVLQWLHAHASTPPDTGRT